MPPKEKLKEIHTPVIYILGGKEAINYPVGHGGTYRQPHGGEFTIPALAWLDWQLKGDKQAATMFEGEDCGLLKRKDWSISKNRLCK